jgi:hypothetical protein
MDRNALIADFVNQWGYSPDSAANEYFRLALERLISEICPEPAIATKTSTVPLRTLKPKRMITFED